MGIVREFRTFAVKGNAIDLAVGVIIGAAFQRIVDSLVKDILTPALSPLTSSVDFASWKVGPFLVGQFVNAIVQFLLVAIALFFIVKAINRVRFEEEKKPEPAKEDPIQKQIAQNERMIALLEEVASHGRSKSI